MIIKVGGLEPLGPIGVYAYDAEQGLCNGRASVSFIIQLGDNRDVPPPPDLLVNLPPHLTILHGHGSR